MVGISALVGVTGLIIRDWGFEQVLADDIVVPAAQAPYIAYFRQ